MPFDRASSYSHDKNIFIKSITTLFTNNQTDFNCIIPSSDPSLQSLGAMTSSDMSGLGV